MKNLLILILFMISFLYADIQIISSPECRVETLSRHDVKNIFMLKEKSIEDEPVTVLESSDHETYRFFVKKFLKKSIRKMKVYWTRMLFTGKKIPPKKLSLEELTLLDTNGSCYISYLPVEEKPKDWKILIVK